MDGKKLIHALMVLLLAIVCLLLVIKGLEMAKEVNVDASAQTVEVVEVEDVAALVGEISSIGDFDPSYVLGLLAESGNLNPHSEIDRALLASRKILLTSDINANSTKQVVGSLILLNEQDQHAPIDLYVRTNGGYYDDVFAVVDVMRMIDAPVNTYAIGGCHSSGAIIVASGTGTRAAYTHALLMVHDNLSEDDGRYSLNTKENHRMRAFWGGFKQLPKSWFAKVRDQSNYLTAEEALSFGLVDQVLAPE